MNSDEYLDKIADKITKIKVLAEVMENFVSEDHLKYLNEKMEILEADVDDLNRLIKSYEKYVYGPSGDDEYEDLLDKKHK